MEQAEGDADMAREVAQSMLGDKMTFYVDGKPIEAEVVQTEDVDGVVVQTSERVNGHLINQYTREELDALTAPPQQANDNADVARPHPVDEIRQPQEGQNPKVENNAVDEASTASKIPQDESGEYDYMQAEPSKAWAALLEQTDGDADMAREVAQSMLNDKVAELEQAQKQQPKEGKSVAEKIAARKEHKANIERIESEIERWKQIIQNGEERQAEEKSRSVEAGKTPAVDTKPESGVDGEVKSEDRLQPIGKGVFGNIYDQFKGKVKEAFDFLMKHKSGDLLGVFHRDGFGDIDLVWGDNGGGLAHIIQRHVEEQNDFNSVEEVRDVIDDVIKNGSINEKKSKWDKVVFEKDGYSVVVSRNLRDKDGNIIEQNKDWVVTAFDNSRGRNSKKRESSSDVTQVTPNTNKGGRAVAPNDNSSESKDTKSKAEGQEKSEESKETSLSEQISTASAEMNTNPTDAQKPNDGSKKKEDSGASENGEGKEEVKPQEELKPKKPKNEKGEESKADGEKGKGEKIEDVGEKIEGARKDALKKLAESMEQATEEALVAMPFSKAFKRPNLKKAVEDGVLRAEDALFAQAVMSAYLSRKKPLMSKSRSNYERERSEKTIKVWAHHAYNGVEKLKKLFSLSPSERDTFMREEMNRPAYDPKDVEKRKQDLMEWNPGKVFNGTCYPINAIRLWNDVCTQLGYEVGTEVPQLFSEVLPTTGYDSYVLVAANGTKFYPARSLNSYNAVVDEIVYQTKVANADADTDHPKETFEVKGSGEMKTKSSGKWYVVTQASLSAKPHKDIFSSKEEAEKFAEAYMKNDGKKVDKYRYASEPKEVKVFDGYGEYAVVLRRKNIGKGTTTDFELKYYNTEAEARVAIDAEHDELNELANKELAKDKGSKSASTKKPICSIEVYTKDGKSWKYGIVLSDKYAPKKSALNTMPYYLAKDFNTRKEAQAYLDAHKEEIEAKAAKVDEARRNFKYFTANGERVGTDYRHGEDVSADQFREQFGFRGVQFGNWTNQRDRQEAINQAFDAFMDLSRLLGVSPRALSLNGELGVAFGARGSGKALAHYEPKEVVINLTKTSGAGSLAHEWWHALDNYFARQGNVAMGFVTQSKNIEMRDELRQAFNTLIDHLEKSPYNQRSKQRGSSYWGTPIEETARMFEQWVNDQLAERGEKSPFLIDADPYIEERYAQMNYEMYKFFMGDKAMPYEEYKQTPQALNGLVYLTRDELQTFGKDLKHIFDTIQQKVDETTGKTLMYHKGGVAVSLNSEEVALRDAVIDRLRENGIDVVTDVSEGQRVLDMANGKERLSGKQKRALETASVSQNEKHQPTVVSSADGAKVLKELDKTKDKYENQSNRSKTFIGDVAKALGARRHGSSSEYATFETKNGKIVTIRLSSHNAKVSNFDNNEEADGISIVVSARQSNGIDNDGNAHITEFYYNAIKLRRADGKPLSEIVRSIKQALYSGEFKDTTGIAERQEVNGDVVREHRVYHGSGADFDSFDHSHMGEGEGAQAYGWGTYVTEVEGIGRTYAEANSKRPSTHYEYGGDTHGLSEERINEILEVLLDAKPSDGHIVSEYEDALGWYRNRRDEYSQSLVKDASLLNPSDISIVVDKTRTLYSVEIPEDNGKNYLDWNERLSDSQIEAIRAYLSDNYRRNKLEDFDASIAEVKDAPNADEVNAWARRGKNVYKVLSHLLGSDDAASKALSEMGFVGIKYPAENRSGGRKDGARNYVIFNEGDAKIVDKVRFFKTQGGEAYGFVVGGKIYIDPRIASSETAVHEYAHLWAEALRSANAKEWSNVVGLMRGTSVWNEVMERYPELKSDDEIADEVLATYSGRRGSERLREEMDRIKGSERSVADKARALGALERVKRALDRFWRGVADFLHIHYKSAEEVADRVMRDLLNGVDPRRLAQKKVQNDIVQRENPMLDDYHTGIRSEDDIHTFAEAVSEAQREKEKYGDEQMSSYPDITDSLLNEAIKTAKITIYSSKPIKDGVFVTPSRMQAQDYAGGRGAKVYSKEVSIESVAWIDVDEGQFAEVKNAPMDKIRFQYIGEMGADERRASLAEETENVSREDQMFLRGEGGVQSMSYDYEKYPTGKVEPNLADKEIGIVQAKSNHGFKNFGEAKEWAKNNIARTYDNEETGGKGNIRISNTAIGKFLTQSAVDKSESKDVHLAVLKVLPDVIRESVDAETHPDFNKDGNEVRSAENSVNKNVLMHRLYGAVDIDGKTYRVKVTLKEDKQNENLPRKAYSYEATKIELLTGTLGKPEDDASRANNSITGAKLLKDVGMSYDPTKKLLDESKKNETDTTLFRDEVDGGVSSSGVDGMRERAVELGRELGADVDVVSDVSEITDANPEVQERKRRAKGWYDAKTGRVVINLAAHSDMADVEQTLLHEIVGHRGLRGLVGHENFNGFLDGVYEHTSGAVREGIDDIARRKGCSKRVATEEYMSGLAEGGFADRKNAGLWQQIRQWFSDMLSRAKIKLKFSISDNELRYLLWRSHELSRMNGREGVVGRARDLAMQNRLGVGNGVGVLSRSNNSETNVAEINNTFNKELQQQIDGKLPNGHIYRMGKPGRILLSTGVPNLPIQMSAKRLQEKATMFDHDFKLSEVKNLVLELQHPLAVFEYGDKSKAQNIVVSLQQDGKNFIVGLSLNPMVNGNNLEINSIRNVFPKDNSEWLNWIGQGKSLYLDKEKVQNLIDQQRTNLADVDYLDLDSITKVVENFENPKVSDGKRAVDSYDGDLETLFRDADSHVDYERALIRDSYERRMKDAWFQSREALQDGMLSLKETMKDIWRSAGKKFSQITDIPDYANPYIGQNRLSSRNAAEVRDFKRRLFSPLLREVGRLAGFSADGRAKLTDYMMAKHGLERNKVMAERDAKHPNSLSCGP